MPPIPASLPQSALSENSVWLFYSEGTGNSSTVCPIGYLDNISAQNIEHTPESHTHPPDEKVTKAGILLCSHQQQRDMRKQRQQKDNLAMGFYRAVGESSLFSLQAEETKSRGALTSCKAWSVHHATLCLAASSQFFS